MDNYWNRFRKEYVVSHVFFYLHFYHSCSCSQQLRIFESWKEKKLDPPNIHVKFFGSTTYRLEKFPDPRITTRKIFDPRNNHEIKFWTHEYPQEQFWTHEKPARKNFTPKKYPRKNILDSQRHEALNPRDPLVTQKNTTNNKNTHKGSGEKPYGVSLKIARSFYLLLLRKSKNELVLTIF